MSSRTKHRYQPKSKAHGELEKMFEQAVAMHQQGQLNMAQMVYQTVLQLDESFYPALHMMGVVAAQMHDFPRAADLISKAIAVYPADPVAHFNLANAFKDMGRFSEALNSYNAAITLKPDYVEAYSNRGNALKASGNLLGAIASYDTAIKLRPNYADAHYNRGNALQDINELHAAIQSYDIAIKLLPQYIEAYSNKGNALRKLNMLGAAAESYQKALSISPTHKNALAGLGQTLLKQGKHREGLGMQKAAFGSICFDLKNGITIHSKIQHATP